MNWQFLSPKLNGFETEILGADQTACVISSVQDYRQELHPKEAKELASMAEIRQIGFSSGRYCAQRAQASLGLDIQPVGRSQRVPIWPDHCVGSISHSTTIAAALVSKNFKSVGIDIEETGRVEEKLYRILFTEFEKELISQSNPAHSGLDAAAIIFSAKEAGYKAIYPLGRKFIGFQEAEILLQPEQQTFSIRYLGKHEPNKALNAGKGYWQIHAGHVLTIFTIGI